MRRETTVHQGSWEWLERQIAEEIRAADKLRRHATHRKPFIEVLAQHPEAYRPGGKTRKE